VWFRRRASQLQGELGKLNRNATTKKRVLLEEKAKISSRMEDIDKELSRIRLWLRKNGK
jgi:hypothetical protein